jgi:hypothetical protein
MQMQARAHRARRPSCARGALRRLAGRCGASTAAYVFTDAHSGNPQSHAMKKTRAGVTRPLAPAGRCGALTAAHIPTQLRSEKKSENLQSCHKTARAGVFTTPPRACRQVRGLDHRMAAFEAAAASHPPGPQAQGRGGAPAAGAAAAGAGPPGSPLHGPPAQRGDGRPARESAKVWRYIEQCKEEEEEEEEGQGRSRADAEERREGGFRSYSHSPSVRHQKNCNIAFGNDSNVLQVRPCPAAGRCGGCAGDSEALCCGQAAASLRVACSAAMYIDIDIDIDIDLDMAIDIYIDIDGWMDRWIHPRIDIQYLKFRFCASVLKYVFGICEGNKKFGRCFRLAGFLSTRFPEP